MKRGKGMETPPPLWSKCNFGFFWNKKIKISGAAWVLRDHEDIVIMHTRRAFSNIESVLKAKLKSCLCARERERVCIVLR